MRRNVLWDEATAGQALARAMAEKYGISYEAVLAWYQKAMAAMACLDHARDAVRGLIEEPFVVSKYGYEERDRDAYHAHYWDKLTKAVGLTENFCAVCGQWYPPGSHRCASSVSGTKDVTL